MITVPKPKFSETNVPIGISKDEYIEGIIDKQAHVLGDAIDRVSFFLKLWRSTSPHACF